MPAQATDKLLVDIAAVFRRHNAKLVETTDLHGGPSHRIEVEAEGRTATIGRTRLFETLNVLGVAEYQPPA